MVVWNHCWQSDTIELWSSLYKNVKFHCKSNTQKSCCYPPTLSPHTFNKTQLSSKSNIELQFDGVFLFFCGSCCCCGNSKHLKYSANEQMLDKCNNSQTEKKTTYLIIEMTKPYVCYVTHSAYSHTQRDGWWNILFYLHGRQKPHSYSAPTFKGNRKKR